MAGRQFIPGEWPDISDQSDYRRLVSLARRRLKGCEHFAEDVVSRACIRWSRQSPATAGVARLEQVIKSEAFSLLRSERRRGDREINYTQDPTALREALVDPYDDADLELLRESLRATCREQRVLITATDNEVLDLLLAGFTLSGTARQLGVTRHEVRKSRQKWKLGLRLLRLDTAAEAAS